MNAQPPTEERESLHDLAETLVYGLDFVDVVVLFALLKRAPDLLALALARAIASFAELEGLAEECRGTGKERRPR